MTAHLVLRQIIQKKQSTNTRLSLRWIAAKVGISSGRLSEILNAKRPLTEYYADKICMALKLSDEEVHQIRMALSATVTNGPALPAEVLAQITDSKPFALLCYFQTDIYAQTAAALPELDPQLAQIARQLQIPVEELIHLTESMIKLGTIEWIKNRWTILHNPENSAYEHPNKANPQGHLNDLELMLRNTKRLSAYERDISSLTLTMDPKDINKAKKMIRAFKREFARNMKPEEPKGVFQINIQLFPVLASDYVPPK